MEAEKSAALLEGILETLKSINTGLQAQEKKWQWLEERLGEPVAHETSDVRQGVVTEIPQVEQSTEEVSRGDNQSEGAQEEVLENDQDNRNNYDYSQDAISFIEHSKLPPLLDNESPAACSPDDSHDANAPVLSDSVESLPFSPSQRSGSVTNSLDDLQTSDAWQIESKARKASLVDYRDWRSPLADSPLRHSELVQKVLGDAWMIPEDGRLPLLFSREYLETLSPHDLEKQLSVLAAFRDKMKTDAFVDFKIVDDCSPRGGNRMVTYRLGKPIKIRGEIRVPVDEPSLLSPLQSSPPLPKPDQCSNGPWRRFIYCQGLNTAQLNFEDFGLTIHEQPNEEAPFLSGKVGSKGWRYYFSSLYSHISCKRLIFSVGYRGELNPYTDNSIGFHITFFEIIPSYVSKHPKFEEWGDWNNGTLYNAIDEERLCESAFTMIEIPPDTLHSFSTPVNTWTVMLLTPPRYIARRLSTPLALDEPLHTIALTLLSSCFKGVRERWTEIRDHLDSMLDEGDALFSPPDHDRLLWDDEIFSRSRKYFWWENYHAARIEPLRKAGALSDWDLRNLRAIEESYISLKNLRLDFSEKLVSTKALRDGLFNASAVVESRASTRLGENVKLLTFVSIFFLPLAFCTSLWSINNMFSTTTLIYTIIILGLSTYLIVFNLNNLVLQASKSYHSLRDHLINQMKEEKGTENDTLTFWAHKGERFDVFRPHHEKAHPSEWWIVVFVFRLFFKKLISIAHLQGANENVDDKGDQSSFTSIESSSSASSEMDSQTGNSTRSSISEDSANPQIAINEEDDIENRPNSREDVDAPARTTNSMAILDQTPTNTVQEPPTPSAPLRSATIGSVASPSKSAPIHNVQTEKEDKSIPVTLSDPPLLPTKRRDMASKTLFKFFRGKNKKVTAEDNGIV